MSSAPYPSLVGTPSDRLLAQTSSILSNFQFEHRPISADIEERLTNFASHHNIDGDMATLAKNIAPLITSTAMLEQAICALSNTWQSHWKNPPNAYQFTSLIQALPPSTDVMAEQKLLKSYL